MLNERFQGTAFTLGDIKKFVERAEVLGHTDKTFVGQPGEGLELFIGERHPSALYCSDCTRVFPSEELLTNGYAGGWAVPYHLGARGYTCSGAGKNGVTSK